MGPGKGRKAGDERAGPFGPLPAAGEGFYGSGRRKIRNLGEGDSG